jgi:L,D-transpeptidase ErfK/SrfK
MGGSRVAIGTPGLSRRGVLGAGLAAAAAAGLGGGAGAARAATLVVPPAYRDDMVGEPLSYVTEAERTLLEVAREHNIGVPQLNALNPGVDPWVPGDGKRLALPTAHLIPDAPREGIIINKAELRLYFFPRVGPVQHYAIGIGKDGFDTPTGPTRIARKRFRPTWIPTQDSLNENPALPRVVPPGPDNPLGEYAMNLGFPGAYLIHSTNKPYGVGRRVSHGCIRMYPEGMARLFPQVAVGTRVSVVDQFVKVGRHRGELYIEVQPSLRQIDELEATYRMSPDPLPVDPRTLVVARAGLDFPRIDWDAVDAAAEARQGVPVQITRGEPWAVSEDDGGPRPAAGVAPAPAASGEGILPAGHGIY